MVTIQAQTFDFSLSFLGVNENTGNYQVALMATPNSSINDGVLSDIGAAIYLPLGATVGNFITGDSSIPAMQWSSNNLGSNANGDAYFFSRIETSSTSALLNGSMPFQLLLFDIITDTILFCSKLF